MSELNRLESLYRDLIVDYGGNPHNFGTMKEPTIGTELINPSCGDVINVQLKIKDNKIIDVLFNGQGCLISQASASIMTDLVKNKTIKEAFLLKKEFSQMLIDPNFKDTDDLEDAEILRGVNKFPARVKCATLAWNALEKSLVELEEKDG